MNNERIDVTQYENRSPAPWSMTEDMQVVVIPANHESTMEMRLYTGSGTNSRLIAKAPELIAELERCYYLIAKMQESIVKTIGECWVCGDYIDSCDSNTCERQILEDIELGTASE
jgi:hypothetical protein